MGLDGIIRERHLLTHPFYQRWQNGKVQLEVLQEYAKQYYHYEKALPEFLSSAIEHIDDDETKRSVAGVLEDERSNPKAHTDLWLDFALALGLTLEDVKKADATARTTNLVETYTSLCSKGSDEALGAIYAYESQLPKVAEAKADGLRRFYGVDSEEALAFFDLHSTLDIVHAKAIRSGLKESEQARASTHLALDAWWGMLDQFEAMSL